MISSRVRTPPTAVIIMVEIAIIVPRIKISTADKFLFLTHLSICVFPTKAPKNATAKKKTAKFHCTSPELTWMVCEICDEQTTASCLFLSASRRIAGG